MKKLVRLPNVLGHLLSMGSVAVLSGILGYLSRKAITVFFDREFNGLLFSTLSLVTLCVSLCNFGLNQSTTMLGGRYYNAGNYTKYRLVYLSSFSLKLLASSLAFILYLVSSWWILSCTKDEFWFVFLIGLLIPLQSIKTLQDSLLRIEQRFYRISLFILLQSSLLLALILLLHYSGGGRVGVASAYICSTVLVLCFVLYKKLFINLQSISTKRFWATARQVFRFSKWVAITSACYGTIMSIDTIMLNIFHGELSVADYSVAVPLAMMLQSVCAYATVLTPLAVRFNSKNDRAGVYRCSTSSLFISICLAFALALFFIPYSEWVVVFLFDKNYLGAALPLTFLIVSVPFWVNSQLNMNLLSIIRSPRKAAFFILIMTLVNIALNLVFIPIYGAVGAAAATSITFLFSGSLSYYLVVKNAFDFSLIRLSIGAVLCLVCFSHWMFELEKWLILLAQFLTFFLLFRKYILQHSKDFLKLRG